MYDTINYTTTGALGDYFDSSVGLGADGIDNEMSFSHLDKNINFDPHTEQLHVDGNKSLLYAHLSNIVNPVAGAIDTPGANGYVANSRLKRAAKDFTPGPPANSEAQADIAGQLGTFDPQAQAVIFPFEVKRTNPQGTTKGIFNGGMRVDVRTQNVQGIGSGVAHIAIQCKGCDEHPGVTDDDEWVTVSEDYNQSPAYAQAGVTAALNRPQAFKKDGTPVEWRAVLTSDILNVVAAPPAGLAAEMDIDFTQGPASTDGATGGGDPAQLRGYDVANTDFLSDLDPFFTASGERFSKIDPRKVINGQQSLSGLHSLVLADDPLPGFTGDYAGQAAPSGPPTADFTFDSSGETVPGGGSGAPGTFEQKEFTIGPNALNGSLKIHIDWTNELSDYDLSLFHKESNGDLTQIASDGGGAPETSEEIVLPGEDGPLPGAGDYVIQVTNFAAPDNAADPWSGTMTFDPPAPGSSGPASGGTGDYTVGEKNTWFAKLKQYAQGGGNLVLTDGAMRSLGELTTIPGNTVERGTVYAGQVSFADVSDGDTTDEPLAKNVRQPGSKFNGGDAQKRRQTFEPTPLGFSIQNSETGANESHARQYHVDKDAFTAAGGKVVATSADNGTGEAAADFTRVTVGEIPVGQGHIRVAGALLPQPTAAFDHPLGVEPFAVTYTGYIVFCNLIDCTVTSKGPGAGSPAGSSGTAAAAPKCVSTRGGVRSKSVGTAALGRTRARQRKLLDGTRLSDRPRPLLRPGRRHAARRLPDQAALLAPQPPHPQAHREQGDPGDQHEQAVLDPQHQGGLQHAHASPAPAR